MGVARIKMAKNHCKPRPQYTILRLISFRLLDIRYAIPRIVKMPKNPVSLSIILLRQLMGAVLNPS